MASLLNTIILLGSVQGFIVSSLLFFSKKNRHPNRLLAILILLISLACFNLYGNYKNWFNADVLRLIVNFVPLVVVMPLGPLIYFYVQSSLDPEFVITKKHRLHFYPVLIDLVPVIAAIIFIAGLLTRVLKNNPGPWGSFIDNYNVYADIPRWMSVSFYLWLSAKHLRGFTKAKEGNLNELEPAYTWLRQLISTFIAFQVWWMMYLIPYIIPKYTNWMLDTLAWYPIYIPMAFLIYWLGIKGYMVSNQPVFIKKNNGNGTGLPPELVQEVIASLAKTMEENKIFLNPNLNLATMAAATGYPQKTISAVLNQHLHKSFNEFINGYRIQTFKEKLHRPELNHLTIAGIALQCGFNSQATFQRTFKEFTGKSPSEFKKTPVETINHLSLPQ